jgi:hypothetical protein
MVELVPIRLDDAIVLNVAKHCRICRTDCRDCCDIGVAVHNWLISTELRYVLIDLQDEKDVCPTFLQEIIQLRKRLRMPFLFAGVMDRPLKVLDDYSYTVQGYPVFVTPEDAIAFLRSKHPLALEADLNRVRLNEVLQVARPRSANRFGDEDEDAPVDDEDEEVEEAE